MASASRKLNDKASTSVAFNQYGEEKSMLGDIADRPLATPNHGTTSPLSLL
jgi:hypothetical protein